MLDQFKNTATQQAATSVEKAFVSKVFTYMSGALAVTGFMAYLFGTNLSLLSYLINFETGSQTILGWVVMLSPLAFVFLFGKMVKSFSPAGLLTALLAFSALMGISMSYIFVIYTQTTITQVFFITAGTFGIMAFAGYTTKTDLSKFGSIMYMGLIGIILASVVNWFMGSAMLDYIISIIGVLVFTGLTAYDMQTIRKNAAAYMQTGEAMASKLAMMSALSLYLDFINLFLMLLRLFGSRD